MSIGTSSVALTINRAVKLMIATGGPAWFRNLVTLTLTGTTETPGNMVLLVYRGSALVALAQSFSGGNDAVTGPLDLNRPELESIFEDVKPGAVRELDLFLYDADVPDLIAFGSLDVLASRDYAVPTPLPAIMDSTIFKGCFAWYQGKTYIRSKDDGKYRIFQGAGSGDSATTDIDDEGIDIPGAPAL